MQIFTNPTHLAILPESHRLFLEQLVIERGGMLETAKLLRTTPDTIGHALTRQPFSGPSLGLGPDFLLPRPIADRAPPSMRDTWISRNALHALLGPDTKLPKGCALGWAAAIFPLATFRIETIRSVTLALCGNVCWAADAWTPDGQPTAACAEDVSPELWLELFRAHELVHEGGATRAKLARATREVMGRRKLGRPLARQAVA
jgi:hypothetical protein